MKRSILGLFIVLVVSCSSSNPPVDVMGETEMISYLIDLHITEASVQNLRLKKDSAELVFGVQQKYLHKKHNITDTTFVVSYNYYLEHPVVLESIYSAVVDSISLRQSLLNEVKK